MSVHDPKGFDLSFAIRGGQHTCPLGFLVSTFWNLLRDVFLSIAESMFSENKTVGLSPSLGGLGSLHHTTHWNLGKRIKWSFQSHISYMVPHPSAIASGNAVYEKKAMPLHHYIAIWVLRAASQAGAGAELASECLCVFNVADHFGAISSYFFCVNSGRQVPLPNAQALSFKWI